MLRRTSWIVVITLAWSASACGPHKIALLPPSPEGLYSQGLKDFHLGTPEGYAKAADLFRKARRLKPAACDYSLNLAQSLLFLATEHLMNSEESEPQRMEARSLLDSVVDTCTSSHGPFILRLQALIAGRGPAASELIDRAVEMNPSDAMNWVVLGYLDPASPRLVTPDGSGIWLAMTRAAQLLPDSALIQYELGKNSAFFSDKKKEARRAFERAIENSPRHFRAYLALADVTSEDVDVAQLYGKVVTIAPNFIEGRMALANFYASVDELEQATRQYATVISLNPQFVAAHFRLGLLQLRSDLLDEAEMHFNKVTELNPESFEAFYYLGNISYRRSSFEKAKAQYEQALRIRGDYAEAEYGLGEVYLQQNQSDLAELRFNSVIKMRPQYAAAYMSLAKIRVQRHQHREALKNLESAIEGYEADLKSLNVKIANAEAHPKSRTLLAAQKRDELERDRVEESLQRVRKYKLEVEQTIQ
jgi:tetratricopeptide (TPR) repeat protein